MLQKDKTHSVNNFDFIRLVAALLVIEGHSFALSDINLVEPFSRLVKSTYSGEIAVDIFFLISGYLITKSYLSSNNLFKYILNRVLRIAPGLIVCCLLTVFFIIPLVFYLMETLPNNYFHQISTYRYLYNILLYPIQFTIDGISFSKGVFGNAINGSLWTLSYEFTCYIIIAILGITRLLKKEAVIMIFTMSYIISICQFPSNFIVLPYQIAQHLSFFMSLFFCGSIYYFFEEHIKYSISFVLFSFIALIYFSILGKYFNLAFVIFGSYIVFGFAFKINIGVRNIAKHCDLSYGVYIYGFLVQQIIVYCWGGAMSPYLNMFITYPIVLILAYYSWQLVEKPCLGLKKY